MSVPLDLILTQCEIHQRRMLWAMQTLAEKFPLSAATLRTLDDATIAVLDQFTTRFAKLQDAIGAKLLPAVLELTKEPGDFDAYLDKLDRLEKIGALPSVDEWLELREMRNAFAHDYPEDSALQAATLNRAFAVANRLVDILHHVANYASRYANK
jgi:hypothetical protein